MELGNLLRQHHARRHARMRQYSRAVRWMKVVLPFFAFILIGLIFFTGSDRGAVIDLENAADAAMLGAGLKLENPRFAGVTDDGDPFILTARSALPDGATPDRIDLEHPTGEVRLSDGITLVVTAADGRMYRKSEQLHLSGGVEMETSNGYRAVTQVVALDLAAKTAVAPGAIEATGPRGDIRADRMQVRRMGKDNRDVAVRFEGNVRVIYRPKGSE